MDKTAYLLSWYLSVVTTLVFCLLFLIYISFDRTALGVTTAKYNSFKALPASSSTINSQEIAVNRNDARAIIIEQFFKGYKAPLSAHSLTFISVADKYDLDYRLLPSIAMQESNGGKILPKNSFNPFGYGIYGGQVKRFTNFDEAIERVGRGIKEDYIDKGLTTPWEIMTKYTPPSVPLGGPWAAGVSTFMAELQ